MAHRGTNCVEAQGSATNFVGFPGLVAEPVGTYMQMIDAGNTSASEAALLGVAGGINNCNEGWLATLAKSLASQLERLNGPCQLLPC